MRAFWSAAAGGLDPFVLVLEGSVPNEQLSGDGHWAALGVDPDTGDPIPTDDLDRSPGSAGRRGAGARDLRRLRRHPGDARQPDRRDGAAATTWARTGSRGAGVPIVNLPGCPVQPDNITETLLHLALHIAGVEEMIELDEQGRPTWLFGRTVQEGCGRAGFAEQGEFAERPADPRGCLVKLGCKGPVVKCNVPIRGWVAGVGGCPNVGGICIGLHDARLPGSVHAVHGAGPARHGRRAWRQFTYGPVLRRLRRRAMEAAER